MAPKKLLQRIAPIKPAPAEPSVEAVEKVPKQIPGQDAEKNDLIERATINDLMLAESQVTLRLGRCGFFLVGLLVEVSLFYSVSKLKYWLYQPA